MEHCFFCGEDDYALLDVHRIIEGANGGEYTEANSLVVCSNCHRKVHDGQIRIAGKFKSTKGPRPQLLYYENNIEKWSFGFGRDG